MKAALIGGNSISSQWTVSAMNKYFECVDHLYIKYIDINFSGSKAEILYKGCPIAEYDCVLIKGSFRYAELMRALADLYSHEDKAFLPFRPDAYTIAHDKLLTQLILQKKSIPMPRTYLSATIAAARSLLSHMKYPIIMKFPKGTQGKGVMFADSFASASSILDALHALKQPFIIQEYIDTNATDMRLFVVGEKVVAAYKRTGNGGEVRANIHQGGVGEAFEPDEYTKTLAITVAKCLGAGICGVDLLEGLKGPIVIEANLSPGLQGVTKYSGVDVADQIARYLFEQTKKKKGGHSDVETREMLLAMGDMQDQEMIVQLDFRGSKILLPEMIVRRTGFTDKDDVQVHVKKGFLELKKFM